MKAWGREPALTSDQADLLPFARSLTRLSRSPEKELKRMNERKKTAWFQVISCPPSNCLKRFVHCPEKIYTREMLAREYAAVSPCSSPLYVSPGGTTCFPWGGKNCLLRSQTGFYRGYQRFLSRAAGFFGVGRKPTHLRPLASSCSFGIMIIIIIIIAYSHAVNR